MRSLEKKTRKFVRRTWIRIQPYIFIILMASVVAVVLLFGAAAQTVSAIFIAITLVTYALIATEKMHRTLAALGGAITTLIAFRVTGLITDLNQALDLVSWSTLLIIITVAIISDIAKDSGIFHYIIIKIVKRSKGKPEKLLLYISLLTFLLTALLGNVPAFMIMSVLTVMITKEARMNPVPYIMTEIIIANASGVSTIVASFVNLLVSGYFNMNTQYFLSYVGFLAIGIPISLITMGTTYLFLKWYYRKDISKVDADKAESELLRKRLMSLNEKDFIKNPIFFRNSAVILIGTLALFAASSFIGLPFYLIGLMGAFAFIYMSGIDPREAFHKVDWSLIFFIMGLFIVVGGIDKAGVLEEAGNAIGAISGGSLPVLLIVMTLFSGILSGFMDNISVTTALLYAVNPIVLSAGLATPTPVLWAMMTGASFGANLTPIGGIANILGFVALEKEGAKQSWKKFFLVSIPVTFMCLGISIVYLVMLSTLLRW